MLQKNHRVMLGQNHSCLSNREEPNIIVLLSRHRNKLHPYIIIYLNHYFLKKISLYACLWRKSQVDLIYLQIEKCQKTEELEGRSWEVHLSKMHAAELDNPIPSSEVSAL